MYQVVEEKGPDHSKYFKVAANVCGDQYPAAWGRNKKEAEQRAARNALSIVDGKPAPCLSEECPSEEDNRAGSDGRD